MPHAEVSMIIRAPRSRVAELYRDYQNWPDVFPATIRDVRLVKTEPPATVLEIVHRDGIFPNVMIEVSPERIDLLEAKHRFDGTFVNRFESIAEGTRYSVSADIALKGSARVLEPFLGWYIRRQIVRYVLEPLRKAAEGTPGVVASRLHR